MRTPLSFRRAADPAGQLEFHPQRRPWIFERTAGARNLHHHHKATAPPNARHARHATCAGKTYCTTPLPFAQRHAGKKPSGDTNVILNCFAATRNKQKPGLPPNKCIATVSLLHTNCPFSLKRITKNSPQVRSYDFDKTRFFYVSFHCFLFFLLVWFSCPCVFLLLHWFPFRIFRAHHDRNDPIFDT